MQERRPPDEPGTTPELSGVIGRPPPFDADAEGAVLASCLLNEEIVPEVVQRIRPGDFYSERHARMYEGILELYTDRRPINIVSLGTLLKDKGRIAQVGGMGYLTEVLASVPAVRARDVIDYCATVRSKARIRRFIATTQRLTAEAYLETGDTDAFLKRAGEAVQEGLQEDRSPDVSIASTLEDSMARAVRRQTGEEMPIPLPWPSLKSHFGGGLWPGVHFINSTTGIGKTAWALQVALGAAKSGVPVAYVALELEPFQLDMRLLGDTAGVPWSNAYTGQVSNDELLRMTSVIDQLKGLPFRAVFGEPQGWAASRLKEVGERLRRDYPETNGPGSRPLLLILDFLQIIGEEEDAKRSQETKDRISRASYIARYLAARLNLVVLVISSVSREKAKLLSKEAEKCLAYRTDDDGRPIRRKLMVSEELIGTGKESGDIEYSGDSVSVIFRVETEGAGALDTNTIFATVKGRATGPRWSPMVFTDFRYVEPPDGGASWVAAQEDAKNKKETAKAERAARADAAKATKEALKAATAAKKVTDKENEDRAKRDAVVRDTVAVVRYILDQTSPPSVRTVREELLSDSSTRWDKVQKELKESGSLISTARRGISALLRVDVSKLPTIIREKLDAK